MKMKLSSRIYSGIVFCFLFAPIVVLLVFSFNDSKSLAVFSGFSLRWYEELLRDAKYAGIRQEHADPCRVGARPSLRSSAPWRQWASISSARKWYRAVMNTVTDIPMTNPDIITGISLMLMFVFVGRLFGASTSLNFVTLLIAHVTFCTPYVILQVLPKLQQMDKALREAATGPGLYADARVLQGGAAGNIARHHHR